MNRKICFYIGLSMMCGNFLLATDHYVTYDSNDATSNIQSAINNAGYNDRIILAFQGSGTKWISGPLALKSNIEFVLEDDVVLEAKSGAISLYTSFIRVSNGDNITVSGYNAVIRMPLAEYSDGEHRHCLSFTGCSNITVRGVSLEKSGGDGIYLGTTTTQTYCYNVLIEDVICDGNARQGISIISGENIEITNCQFLNTGQYNPTGVATGGPFAGIDFEPNNAGERLINIVISDCTFTNNKAMGIQFWLKRLDQTSSDIDIAISNCYIAGSQYSVLGWSNKGVSGSIDITECVLLSPEDHALYFYNWDVGVEVNISESDLLNPTQSTVKAGIQIAADSIIDYCTGNINFSNIYIMYETNPNILELQGANSTYKIEDINGKICSDSLNAVISYTTNYYDNCTIGLYLPNFSPIFSGYLDQVGGTDSEAFFTSSDALVYPGDYNGDGKTDMFVKGYGTYRALYLANSSGDGFDCAFAGDADGLGGTDSEAWFTSDSAIITTGDFNGDGKTDLFVKGYGVRRALYCANYYGTGFNRIFMGDADGLGGTDSEAFFTSSDAVIYPGDYNGDGKTDMFVKGYGTYRALYLANSSGDGFDCAFAGDADGLGGTDSEAWFTSDSAIITTGDFNGDGKTDLFVKGYGVRRALYCANYYGTGFNRIFMGDADGLGGTDSDAFFTSSDAVIYPGDYNGDGKTDLFLKGYGTYRALYTGGELY